MYKSYATHIDQLVRRLSFTNQLIKKKNMYFINSGMCFEYLSKKFIKIIIIF